MNPVREDVAGQDGGRGYINVARGIAEMVGRMRAHTVEEPGRVGVAREDGGCSHVRWRHMMGPADCGTCGETMNGWINICRRCEVLACARCRLESM